MPIDAITRYLNEIESLQTESARSHRLAQLLQELFGTEPGFIEQYAQGLEQIVRTRHKDRLLRGQVDNLFGNLVIEFEADLEHKHAEAETQLAGYVHILWAEEPDEPKTPYLCLATDGVRFAVYTPIALTPSPSPTAWERGADALRVHTSGEGAAGSTLTPSPLPRRGRGERSRCAAPMVPPLPRRGRGGRG